MPDVFAQDPDERFDYVRDWSAELGADTITTSTWTPPAGITVEDEANDATTATMWVSGGVDGENYDIVNRIETAAGRKLEDVIQIRVRAV